MKKRYAGSFLLIGCLLVLLFWWHLRGLSRRAVLHGCLMGAAFFATMALKGLPP